MPGGRPTKISPEIIKKICDAIEVGAYIETAAVHAGINKETFYAWLKKAARAKKPSDIYLQFSNAIESAKANGELRDILILKKAADAGAWQAAAWKLERKFPEKWGRKDRVESVVDQKVTHSGSVGVSLDAEVKVSIERLESDF